tara:strand:- start:256 stop:618 length:363 start_codon:yes stop_codon:yes gene_type:complete
MKNFDQQIAKLADLSLLPRDDEGPTFSEPWQAQAFSVVVELIESKMITREEWTNELSSIIGQEENDGDFDTAEKYYNYWLLALEQLVIKKNISDASELLNEKQDISESDHHRRQDQRSES